MLKYPQKLINIRKERERKQLSGQGSLLMSALLGKGPNVGGETPIIPIRPSTAVTRKEHAVKSEEYGRIKAKDFHHHVRYNSSQGNTFSNSQANNQT